MGFLDPEAAVETPVAAATNVAAPVGVDVVTAVFLSTPTYHLSAPTEKNKRHGGMVHACCVINCHNFSHDRRGKRVAHGVRFFSFPAWKQNNGTQVAELTKRRRMAWVAAVRRTNITFSSISRHMFVCSRHFHTGKPAYEMLQCDPDWVPSLHLGHTEVKATHIEQYKRRSKRQQALKGNNKAPATPPDPAGQRSPVDEAAPPDVAAQGSQVDEAAPPDVAAQRSHEDDSKEQQECLFCSHRRTEINRLLEENRILKEELSKKKMGDH